MRTTRRWLAVPVITALLGTGACGDGGDRGEAAPSTTLSPEARARAINLNLDDLPPEFVAAPGADGTDEGVTDCIPGTGDALVSEAQTPLFERSTETGVQFVRSRTSIFGDEQAATTALEAVEQPDTINCLRDGLAGDVLDSSAGAQLLSSDLAPTESIPAVGEQSTALAGSVTFAAPGAEQPLGLSYSVVVVRTDSVVSLLVFGGLIDSLAPETVVELSRLVADRQAAT